MSSCPRYRCRTSHSMDGRRSPPSVPWTATSGSLSGASGGGLRAMRGAQRQYAVVAAAMPLTRACRRAGASKPPRPGHGACGPGKAAVAWRIAIRKPLDGAAAAMGWGSGGGRVGWRACMGNLRHAIHRRTPAGLHRTAPAGACRTAGAHDPDLEHGYGCRRAARDGTGRAGRGMGCVEPGPEARLPRCSQPPTSVP